MRQAKALSSFATKLGKEANRKIRGRDLSIEGNFKYMTLYSLAEGVTRDAKFVASSDDSAYKEWIDAHTGWRSPPSRIYISVHLLPETVQATALNASIVRNDGHRKATREGIMGKTPYIAKLISESTEFPLSAHKRKKELVDDFKGATPCPADQTPSSNANENERAKESRQRMIGKIKHDRNLVAMGLKALTKLSCRRAENSFDALEGETIRLSIGQREVKVGQSSADKSANWSAASNIDGLNLGETYTPTPTPPSTSASAPTPPVSQRLRRRVQSEGIRRSLRIRSIPAIEIDDIHGSSISGFGVPSKRVSSDKARTIKRKIIDSESSDMSSSSQMPATEKGNGWEAPVDRDEVSEGDDCHRMKSSGTEIPRVRAPRKRESSSIVKAPT